MSQLRIHHLYKSFGATPVLEDVNLEIKQGEKAGLIGVNGAGKSTLLKILAGIMAPDQGQVVIPADCRIAYQSQDAGLESENTVWEELSSVFAPLKALEENLRVLEQQMADPDLHSDEKELSRLMAEYGTLAHEFETAGGYEYESRLRGVLKGLGFSVDDTGKKVSQLSGGQKTRLALGKVLLSQPDVMLLDEPTNYLDLESVQWLEEYLKEYPGTVLLVSHDRYFLDQVVTKIFEVENCRVEEYAGNYSYYVTEKEHRREEEWRLYEANQREIERLEAQIENFRNWRNFHQAFSREKALARLPKVKKPAPLPRRVRFQFPAPIRSGRIVLEVEHLSFAYGNKPVLKDINLLIRRDERVGLIGPNGVGKTTLLKAILGKLTPDSGQVYLGHHVIPAYYEQEQTALDEEKTVLEEIWDAYPDLTHTEVRTHLGSFLFRGEEVFKPIAVLSGGEKSRVALAKLLLSPANFLVLDEPTNHLDMNSKEVLEEALLAYQGTVLFISHDRYFLNRVATKIAELSADGLRLFDGNYSAYLARKQEEEQVITSAAAEEKANRKEKERAELLAKQEIRRRKAEVEKLENEIAALEGEIAQLEQALCQPEVFANPEEARSVNLRYQQAREELATLLANWEKAAAEVEAG